MTAGSAPVRRVVLRYVPLAAVVVVQLLLAAFVPSTPASHTAAREPDAFAQPSNGAFPNGADLADPALGRDRGLAGGDRGLGDARSNHGGHGSGAAGSKGATSATATATISGGNTAHCVAGRQFDPAIDFYAPPCQPRFTGRNAGATAQGVTGDEILLIDYYIDPGPAPSAFLKAQQLAASAEEQARFDRAVETFINRHFELYGRKVRIELWKSPCGIQPPDETCFRADAAHLVIDKKPFAVVNNLFTPMSFLYDELSQRHTVNLGGWHYRDAFSAARRPYHWDPNISGSRMARTFADWYCRQLHRQPVQYAGQPRPPGTSFNGKSRVLGVLGFNDPETIAVVTEELEPALAACGARVAHTFYFEPNLQTGREQNATAIGKLRSEPEATTVLCICGPALGQLHQQMQDDNYYPEQLMAGASLTDLDSVAQFFSGPLGCATMTNCQADNMFGLAQLGPQEPRFGGVGTRIWRVAGSAGDAPYERVDVDWTYWRLLASLIQATGPDLTPEAMERAAPGLPALGGGDTGWPRRHFTGDGFSSIRDMQVVYWSTTKPSPYNGTAGTWVRVGSRFEIGHSPSGPLVLPPKPR